MRLIDAERMPNDDFFKNLTDTEKAKVLQWFISAPTVDAVEVVRCSDCYWSKNHRKLFGDDVCDCAKWPSNDAHRVKALDDYCSDAYKCSQEE